MRGWFVNVLNKLVVFFDAYDVSAYLWCLLFNVSRNNQNHSRNQKKVTFVPNSSPPNPPSTVLQGGRYSECCPKSSAPIRCQPAPR